MKAFTHLRLDFAIRALALVMPEYIYFNNRPRGFRISPSATHRGAVGNFHDDPASEELARVTEDEVAHRIACKRGARHQHTRTARWPMALPQLGERPTCPECCALWDVAQILESAR